MQGWSVDYMQGWSWEAIVMIIIAALGFAGQCGYQVANLYLLRKDMGLFRDSIRDVRGEVSVVARSLDRVDRDARAERGRIHHRIDGQEGRIATVETACRIRHSGNDSQNVATENA